MTWYMIVFVFVIMLGAVSLAFQIFRLTEMDAKSRGLKHPKFWGFFSLSGNNGGGGLLLYLLGRRKYPSTMTEEEKAVMTSRKKKAGVSLCFIAVGAIAMILSCLTLNL